MICGSGKHNSVHIEQMSRSGAALTKRLDSAGRSFATARLGAGIVSSLNVGTAGAPEAAPRHAAGAPEAAPRALFAMATSLAHERAWASIARFLIADA